MYLKMTLLYGQQIVKAFQAVLLLITQRNL